MNLTLLVKTLESGQVAASVLELPGYRAEGESKEIAIECLKMTLIDNFKDAETLPWQIPVDLPSLLDNPWKNLFGLFKDDRYFEEVLEIIEAGRNSFGDEDLDPEFYLS